MWSIGIGATRGVGHRCTQVSSSRVDLTTSQIKSEPITKRGVSEYWISSGRPSGQHTQMAWFVSDIAATVAELKRRGVRFEEYDFPGLKTIDGVADLGYEKSAWFRDSEGNLLALGQLV